MPAPLRLGIAAPLLALALPAFAAGVRVSDDGGTYTFDDGTSYTYTRPTPFGWVARGVTDLGPFVRDAFAADNLGNLALILGSTAALVHYDQQIYEDVSAFGRRRGIGQDAQGSGATELPHDFGSTLYFIGDGRVPLSIIAYMAGVGSLQDDVRMMSTASQLAEVMVSTGLVSESLKIMLGRETPEARTEDGGDWHGPVAPAEYVRNQTSYDAMPSGHLATAVATMTVLAQNYHEHEVAIYSVGGVLIAMLSFQMVNNGVHWAGDYPLGAAIGYSLGKQVARSNRGASGTRASDLHFGFAATADGLLLQASTRF